jgi:biopolymer transport protein ExbB
MKNSTQMRAGLSSFFLVLSMVRDPITRHLILIPAGCSGVRFLRLAPQLGRDDSKRQKQPQLSKPDPSLGRSMSNNLRRWFALAACCSLVLVAALPMSPVNAQQPTNAQQKAAVSPPQVAVPAPKVTTAPVVPAPVVPAQISSTVPAVAAPAAPSASAASDTAIGTTDGTGKSSRSVPAMLHELSPWSMFLSADIIVKIVMIGLAFASLATWTICIAKFIELGFTQRRLQRALDAITEARSIAEARVALGSNSSVLSTFLATALREARLSAGISTDTGIKERAASSFAEITRAEARRMRFGMGVLATIGATSPFVGLFGTVWGIMNSFIGISKSQTTNLAVVAPGIAEALLATAIGLVAAIPAVIIYNHFARVTKGHLELVSRASGAAGRLLSRDLDRAHGGATVRAAE